MSLFTSSIQYGELFCDLFCKNTLVPNEMVIAYPWVIGTPLLIIFSIISHTTCRNWDSKTNNNRFVYSSPQKKYQLMYLCYN